MQSLGFDKLVLYVCSLFLSSPLPLLSPLDMPINILLLSPPSLCLSLSPLSLSSLPPLPPTFSHSLSTAYGRSLIAGVGGVESNYLMQCLPCINDYNHPDLPAIMIFAEYLATLEVKCDVLHVLHLFLFPSFSLSSFSLPPLSLSLPLHSLTHSLSPLSPTRLIKITCYHVIVM